MIDSKFNKKALPIELDVLSNVIVEIIIPYKDNYKGVTDLLENLQLIKNLRFEITLVDDNSQNQDFFKNMKKLPGIKGIRLEQDSGFGFAVNEAVKQSNRDINCVLHSDVYGLEQSALRNLVLALIHGAQDNVALVSGVTDFPTPKECNFLKSTGAYNLKYQFIDKSQFVPMLFCAFSRSAFSKVGGLPTYPYCFFEDKLLSKKFMAFGYKVAYVPQAFCRHHGGQTIKKLVSKNKDILSKLKNNHSLYSKDAEILDNYLNSKKK